MGVPADRESLQQMQGSRGPADGYLTLHGEAPEGLRDLCVQQVGSGNRILIG